jgi:hypothetical protein
MKRFLGVVFCLVWAGAAVGSPTVVVGREDGTCPEPARALQQRLTLNAKLRALLVSGDLFPSLCAQLGGKDDAVWSEAEVAYLYAQFCRGTLAECDHTPEPSRQDLAQAFLVAVWHLRDGRRSLEADLASLNASAASQQVALDSEEAVSAGRPVRGATDSPRTSTRPRVSDPPPANGDTRSDKPGLLGFMVPGPGAVVLGGLGLGLLGSLRRRSVV